MSLVLCGGLAACDWTFPAEDGWLPLVERKVPAGPTIAVPTGSSTFQYYRASDGTIWIVGRPFDPLGEIAVEARSFEAAPQLRTFPPSSVLSADGVVALTIDHTTHRSEIRLFSLTDAPDVDHVIDVDFEDAPLFQSVVRRGPGYFAYSDLAVTTGPSAIHILFDDGTQDVVMGVGEDLEVSCPVDPDEQSVLDPASPSCDPAYLSLRATKSDGAVSNPTWLDSYYLGTRRRQRLFPIGRYDDLQYDRSRALVWRCAPEGLSGASLATGAVRVLPIGCTKLWLTEGQPGLAQDLGGQVWSVAIDGSMSLVTTLPPGTIRAVWGRSIVYTRPGSDAYDNNTYDAWIDDRQVIHAGRDARYSSDGRTLYWLEAATARFGVGDLHAFDLVKRTDHPLVRNVSQFDLLPDGRLVAVARAALDGPWQRAIVIDAARGETRLLMDDADHLSVVGRDVVVTQRGDDKVDTLFAP